jgi:quinol monooxygenase YgiN
MHAGRTSDAADRDGVTRERKEQLMTGVNGRETVIRVGDEPVTVVNVFDVDAERQQELIDLLVEGAEKVMQYRPGFVSVNLLASKDGTRVVNYAQWRSQEDVGAVMADPEVQGYTRRAAELAQASPHVYSVVSVHHA